MPESSPDSSSRPRPRRGGGDEGRSRSFLWYLLLASIGLVFLAAYWLGGNEHEISTQQLFRLLDATRYKSLGSAELADGNNAFIDVASTNSDRRRRYQLPRNLVIRKTRIDGEVDFQPVGGDGKPLSPTKAVRFSTVLSGAEHERKKLDQILEYNSIPYQNAEDGWMDDYGPMFLLVAVMLGSTFYMLRRLSNAPMSFARSRGRLHIGEEQSISFDDVAGIDEAVAEVREIVDFLKNPEKYQKLGGRIPKGVLLVGPPGTGKTLLARAIAGEAGVPFFSLSGSDFVEMFVGVGAARVRDMFQQATAQAPSIIFIDELDALGKSRGGNIVGTHDEREQTLNALLVEMDGFDANAGVIVVAATNRPETLDPALLRPGRFDRNVLVDRPDLLGREETLKVHVADVKLAANVDLRELARITSGFVGADLANLVNEAALLAARREKKEVGMEEFNEAVERLSAGLEKKKRVMSDDEKRRVAYHEAGHALVAYCLPNTDPVHKVSIIPRGLAALGYTMQRPEEDRFLMTRSELESRIKVLLAGTLTEEIVLSDISTGAQNDLERATEISRAMVMDYGMSRMGRIAFRDSNRSAFLPGGGDSSAAAYHSEQTAREIDNEVKRIIEESLLATREILKQRREALESITQRLLERETIDGDELRQLMGDHQRTPRVVPGTATPLREAGS
jgi:cell division protease FtsH